MTIIVGLTGSIGMGKSTTAQMLRDDGLAVWDADATVHKLYQSGGAATGPIQSVFPTAIIEGAVSRQKLRELLQEDASRMDQLQAIVHPLVAADRKAFIAAATDEIVILDIPLLYETGADEHCDKVIVVTADPDIQRRRVLDRGEMSEEEFEMILSRQTPDAEKRARADYVIETVSLDQTRAAVRQVIADIRGNKTDA